MREAVIPVESLESKLDRLSPDQRREVEDFVDFLLSRSAPIQPSAIPPTAPAVPPVMAAAPPVLSAQDLQPVREPPTVPQPVPEPAGTPEPAMTEITAGGEDWITREYMDYGKFEEQPSPAAEAVKKVKRRLIEKGEEDKPRQILDWID